jgi:hypothetical protein
MKTTRDINFFDRVFTRGDLMRFASILDRQVSNVRGERSEYGVTFEDGHKIEGPAEEVFAEEQLNRPCRPYAIEIWLHHPAGYIHIQIRSGNPIYKYENSIAISGKDEGWVNANYTALHDAVDKVAPQSLWWKRHRTILLHLIALGGGTLEFAVIPFFVRLSIQLWPDLPSRLPDLPLPSPFTFPWPWRWALGLPWAFLIRNWLLSMWPSIEFNFGAKYLRPNNRRQKLYLVLTLTIVPLLVSAAYDVLKEIVK